MVLSTLCGTSSSRVDTFGNVATLVFESKNIQQPNFNGFVVRVNASVEGELRILRVLMKICNYLWSGGGSRARASEWGAINAR